MVKCAKRGCKAHALRGKKYCLFHTNQYKSRSTKSTSKKTSARRKPRANFRSKRSYKSYSKRY
jgi:hypothetical protein